MTTVNGYGAREAFIEIDLAIRASRRRLLKANDEHGNKNLRKFILDEFGEVERFALNRLVRAGVFDASEYDTGELARPLADQSRSPSQP